MRPVLGPAFPISLSQYASGISDFVGLVLVRNGSAVHPALQNQDGGHPVYGLAAFADREIGFAQDAIGLAGGEAFIPQVNLKLEALAQFVRELPHLLRLPTFGSAET